MALEYGDKGSKTALVVAEAGEVVVDTEGKVSLPEMRDYLLSMPFPPVILNPVNFEAIYAAQRNPQQVAEPPVQIITPSVSH